MNKFNQLAEEAAVYHSRLKKSVSDGLIIYNENTLNVMRRILDKHPEGCFDMIFADPPYFLSNGGLTVKNGIVQSVNKGEWDKFSDDNEIYIFTCRNNDPVTLSHSLRNEIGSRMLDIVPQDTIRDSHFPRNDGRLFGRSN